ncbi:hypothetical protein [Chitinophaga sp. sic0106]|uniref:hypothetical protein n=1 Tax=Chitinophaga sp. sic0106 TaxID=2854785 RepID=UPI001C489756|nr:hypothetical protein [Chitinophaga sp. sic0106]MBV7532172.1 hypothetical protein [Chitinophaga sp. sic0106]
MNSWLLLLGLFFLAACGPSMKLTVPERFREQATMQHVSGAHKNKMSFANYSTSRIKRGMQIKYPGWGKLFFLDNLVLNQFGISKAETVENEKARFRFSISDGSNTVQVFGAELEVEKRHEYSVLNSKSILNGIGIVQQYEYVFSAKISGDTAQAGRNWEVLMTNLYDRKITKDTNPFGLFKQEDSGLATNGTDTIFIKPLSIKKTEMSNGKSGKLPWKVLSGYELSTAGGVIGILDLVDHNIWYYNELDSTEKLNISAISTALLARQVNNAKW